MFNINVTNLRKNIFDVLEKSVKYNEHINVSTKDGNAIIMSEDDYKGLMATLELTSIPAMKQKIIDGLEVPLSDCVSEDEVVW